MFDLLNLAVLAGLAAYFLKVSWRKWPDPLIDFGRELYTPWRLSEGAVLFRDIDGFYGPLSQCFNGAVFAIFGPGLMTLVAANIVIFAAIVALLYACCRQAWGRLAALVAGAFFVSVFGFSQFVLAGNYNYAAPYAHETTHGVLACLLLVTALGRWVEVPSVRRSWLAGVPLGLTLVLKPEIIFAGAVVTLAALALGWRRHGRPRGAVWLALAGGALLPSMGFLIYFSLHMSVGQAFAATGNAWLSLFGGTHTHIPIQAGFLGFDRPWPNFLEHLRATLVALAVLAGVAGAAWLGDRVGAVRWRRIAAGVVIAGAAWWVSPRLSWPDLGRCLMGLVLLYAGVKIVALVRGRASRADERGDEGKGRLARNGRDERAETMQLLLALLAIAFLARMALNGRIFQYGYYQAALAAVLIPAVVLGEMRGWLRLRHGNARVVVGVLALLTPAVLFYAQRSAEALAGRTEALGKGRDRMLVYPREIQGGGAIVQRALEYLETQPPGQLVVIPDGTMINYLARRPSPVPAFALFGAATAGGREAKLVETLRMNPPAHVIITSADLRDYGVERYGAPDNGRDLLQWLYADYRLLGQLGGDPLDYRAVGAQIHVPRFLR